MTQTQTDRLSGEDQVIDYEVAGGLAASTAQLFTRPSTISEAFLTVHYHDRL